MEIGDLVSIAKHSKIPAVFHPLAKWLRQLYIDDATYSSYFRYLPKIPLADGSNRKRCRPLAIPVENMFHYRPITGNMLVV